MLAHSGVGHGRGQHGLGQPEAVAGDRHGRPIPQRADLSLGIAGECPHRRRIHLDGVGRHSSQTSRFVEDRLGCDGQSGGVDDDRNAVGIGGDHQYPVGAAGVRHELGPPGQASVVEPQGHGVRRGIAVECDGGLRRRMRRP